MDMTIFKSKIRSKLMQLYFTNPESEHYLRELERLLETPVSMIRKELLNLEKEGLFISKKKANLVYWQLNKKYPLFEEWKSIVFKTLGIQGALTALLKKITGIKFAFIYGSYAKNSENPSSDIDIIIVGKPHESNLIEPLRILERKLKREVNYVLYSEEEFNKKRKEKGGFLPEVLKNKIIVLIGEESEIL